MASTNPMHIDVSTLPRSPTSPLWESPHRCVTQMKGGGPVLTLPYQATIPIGTALRRIAIDLEVMVEDNASIEGVQSFLDRYRFAIPDLDSSKIGTTAPSIHPLVQEWFDYRDALKQALEKNREDLAGYLLDQGFSIDGEAMLAMCRTSPGLAKRVIEQGKWEINRPIGVVMPPILGSFVENEEMIQWLLAHGADPNLAASNGKYTILHRAAQYAPKPCLKLLLSAAPKSILPGSHSADVIFHATTAHKYTPRHDRIPIMQYLLDHGAPVDMVAGCGKYEDRDANLIDLWAYGRKTALHWAVEHGQVDVVKFLLDRGADTERKTWSLTTKSKWASVEELAEMCGQDAVKEVLVSRTVPKKE